MNGDGRDEILLATRFQITLFALGAEGWRPEADYRADVCAGPKNSDHRQLIKSPDIAPVAAPWPDLKLGETTASRQIRIDCRPPVVVNP
jgi:hypothetical protein